MIKAGIMGSAGYTGGELIRLLIDHPEVDLVFAQSKSNAGSKINSVHQDLFGTCEMTFSQGIDKDVDVVFLCTSHGESRQTLAELDLHKDTKIIDLSNDFRLASASSFQDKDFVYGLPEINRDAIKNSNAVANPGCFATAIQLAIIPLLINGHEADFYTTAITGSTGAGQSLSATSHFSWRTNNIQPYKTLSHQHLDEINQTIHQVGNSQQKPNLNFVPWRGDFARGILASVQTTSLNSIEALYELYSDFYKEEPFTFVSKDMLHLKQVVNTNKCIIHIEKVGNQVVIHSVIDNLLKGAVGQAVQNLNIMFGLDEKTGLSLKALAF
jgi:N-acetyl-gamma-glutamyl-phosphate reductase